MYFSEAKKQFDVRYYLWATSEFQREIGESFPVLRSFKAGSAWKTYQFMQQLSKEDQWLLAKSLLKRFHPNAVEALGDMCSTDEESLRSRRDVAFSNIVSFGDEIRAKKNAGELIKLASQRRLRKVMATKFVAAFGNECMELVFAEEQDDLRFKMKRAGWVVNTFFDFGRSNAVLNYNHNIESEKSFTCRGVEFGMGIGAMMSFNSYLGIASQTSWSYLREDEVDLACAMVVKLCARFFEILPQLLKGLECEMVVPDKDCALFNPFSD
jgi:hypothetical protein